MHLDEQEVCINFGRLDTEATMYVSDSIWIRKIDKKVARSNGLIKVKGISKDREGNIVGKTYIFPKRLITIRNSISTRIYTNEEKAKLAERLRKAREKRLSNSN